jgi:NAD dependent epimerase/dehydratase
MWNHRKIAITGAAGFIGSHLTDAFVRAGAKVTAVVRYNSTSGVGALSFLEREVRESLKIRAGNVEDSDFMRQALDDHEVVLHLAALIAIPYSYEAPRSYMRANVEGTLNVLEAARRHSIGRVIHTSTSEVYGTALRTPIDESHPLQGQSPYSATKIAADKLAESYYRAFNTPVVTVRPFNTYGPRQSARAFIPTIISQALAQEEIKLGSLDPERDMTYVSDTVAGFMAAAAAKGVEGMTFNLGTGETFSINWFAQRILALMDVEKRIVLDPVRTRPEKSEVLKLVSDNRLARKWLGWEPRVSLDDGLNEAIAFVKANPSLFKSNAYVT